MNTKQTLLKNVEALAADLPLPERLPSVIAIREIMRLVKALLFPDFFDESVSCPEMRRYSIGVNMDKLYELLSAQIVSVCDGDCDSLTLGFIDSLPELRRVLRTDIDAIYANDPAVDNRFEVVFCYPSVHALIHYRAAHSLLKLGVPVIPRIITELAHSATGIDIHPGATIGEYFAIDHGTGVVIGQTCIIGSHVTIYQGVTLGSKNFTLDADGHPANLPRHPIIEDGVTIYSNASVLGRITIGHNAVIGGNVWVTTDVPPHGKITQ
ncbi:MAG: serine acetyltransferase [Bacteroides sp.]|nr:serine acetyltransferase [Bacteroides sp.]MCM1378483.1 serine acetyltransferase [Bacteroides sp.]MCM1444784.1 serine acetyltransferase [Prevotella sp.]